MEHKANIDIVGQCSARFMLDLSLEKVVLRFSVYVHNVGRFPPEGNRNLKERERTNLQSVTMPKIWTHFHSLWNFECRDERWLGWARSRRKMAIKNGDERY